MNSGRPRRFLLFAGLALVLAVLLWCAGPAHGQPVVLPTVELEAKT